MYARATANANLTARSIIGRDVELGALADALDEVEQGTPTWVVVEGEPGIGKTRLLGELRAFADDRGHIVLTGSAAEFEHDTPFSVWADALDAYAASQDFAQDDGWDAELAGELAGILPALRRAGAPADATIAEERYRAHRAVRRLLELLAAGKPLVLVLDDLQWSDRASVELLAALVRRGADAPVLLALAFRRGQAPERLLAALAAPGVRWLALEPLTEDQAGQLLTDVDAPMVAALYRHGGGNPFYLEQLARGSRDGHLAAAPHEDGGGVPAAVAASLADELGSLTAGSRRMLEGAAVAGEPFEAALASAIAELPTADGLGALDDLLARDLVRATEDPRRFTFRHPLVRRAVYDAIRGGSKLAAHARAAAILRARGAPASDSAHHVQASASPGDEDAIALLLEAGAAAQARAPAAAARWVGAALALLPAADLARQIEARVALASAQRALGELDRCRDTLLETLAMVGADDRGRRVELTAQCAAVEHWQGRHADAHQRLLREWESLPQRSSPAAAALQIELAVDGLYEMDFTQTVEMGRRALDAARSTADAPLIAAAASALCLGEAAAGHIEPARAHHAEALAEIDRLSDDELAPRLEALYYLGWAETYLERYDDALAHADRGIAIARASGAGRLLVPMMLVKPYALEMQGRLSECAEVCEGAVESSRLSDNPHFLFWSLFELGFARYFAGDLDGAIAAGEESAQIDDRLAGGTMPAAGGGPGWQLACAFFEAGQVQRAWDAARALGSDDLEHKVPVERNFDWEIMALIALAQDRPEVAEDYARRAEENAAQLGLRLPEALALRARAAVLLHAGKAAEAADRCRASVAAADAIGARLVAAFSRFLLGDALATTGDRKAAIAAWREAEHELDACGSVRVRDEARRALRKLGARVEPRGPAAGADSGVEALTKREREIAALVTDRHTNREIAARLFLSDKTVESHLRNIFIKLGVSSRVEVARTMERAR